MNDVLKGDQGYRKSLFQQRFFRLALLNKSLFYDYMSVLSVAIC